MIIGLTVSFSLWSSVICDNDWVLIDRCRRCDGNFRSHQIASIVSPEQESILLELAFEQFFEWFCFVHASVVCETKRSENGHPNELSRNKRLFAELLENINTCLHRPIVDSQSKGNDASRTVESLDNRVVIRCLISTYLVPTMRSKKRQIGSPAPSLLSIALRTCSSTIPRTPPLGFEVSHCCRISRFDILPVQAEDTSPGERRFDPYSPSSP